MTTDPTISPVPIAGPLPAPSASPAFAAGWKTFAWSAALAVAGVLQTANWATLVPPQDVGIALIVVACVTGALRSLTSTSIFTGTSPAPFPATITPAQAVAGEISLEQAKVVSK